MKRKFALRLALLVMIGATAPAMTGCGESQGAITIGNLFKDWPAKIISVTVNLEAGLVAVRLQPNNPDKAWCEGWFYTPADTDGADRRGINFTDNVITGVNTRNGLALFVVASYDWPYGWQGSAMTPGVKYYFMLGVRDNEGRETVHVYQYIWGQTTQIARRGLLGDQMPQMLVTHNGKTWQMQNTVEVARATSGGQAVVLTSDGRIVMLNGTELPKSTRSADKSGADWLKQLQRRAQ